MNVKENGTVGTVPNLRLEPELRQHKVNGKDLSDAFEGSLDFNGNEKAWKKYLIIKEPAELEPLLKIGDAPVWTTGNHSLVIGKKKARKTLLLTYLISKYARDAEVDILFADTEQGQKHVWKTRERIFRLTGKWINILSLRGLSPLERRNVIQEAVEEGKFKIVIIDGIRDLLSNINDPDQCTELVTWIEYLTVTYQLHIVNVLHQNKVDNNARGHIGSELLNKAEITIELELDEKAGCTIVKCESSRDIPFESFAFTHSAEGLPELIDMPVKGKALTEADQKTRLHFVFDGGHLKFGELVKGMCSHFEVGENKAGSLLAGYIRKGWIIKDGPDRSPATIYKLLINK